MPCYAMQQQKDSEISLTSTHVPTGKEDKKTHRLDSRQEDKLGRGSGANLMTHTWPQQRRHAENGQSPGRAPAAHCFTSSCRQVWMHVHQPHHSRKPAESGVAGQSMLEDVHSEQTDSLPPSNMGMVFMKNSLEATWSASKTQMSSEPGTRVPGGYIWEHTLLMLPDFPFISPAADSKHHCREQRSF